MLEYDWLYDRAWEIGFKKGIEQGKKDAYFDAAQFVTNNQFDIADTVKTLGSLDTLRKHFNDLGTQLISKQVDFPHEELANSRLFHHVRANQLEKLLNRFLEDKDSDPDFPLFDFAQTEKERQSVLSLLEEKDLPKVTQIYLYASLDAIDFYVRKAHEYMQRVLSVSTTDKNPVFADMDIDIFFQEITLEIQIARTASLRIKNDYPNF